MGALEDFVVRLFHHVSPALKEQNIVFDRTHRAGRPARTPGQAQDILTCLHYYKQQVIMATVRDTASIEFKGHQIGLFQDLLMIMLQRTLIRDQFIVIAARQNAAGSNKRQQLEDDIRVQEVAHRQTWSLATMRQLTAHQKQLRALDEDKAVYALLRTKQKFYAGKNRAGCLLAHRLRTQARERRVAELWLPDGTLICQEELIHQQFERFYSDLYPTKEIDHKGMEDCLDSAPVAQLPPVDSAT
ncbi:hypothetical protein NDU88_003156 [Pleurodeles waltl]|uniref:Uncharacterized protein n=1 Tax=Pleurodeles waltl TaxID=8319 RepID=A0AAV7KUR9_PLEWA|nr:hypothetical protein NDU88_003156 [Pleurodeles waltl]